jgi:hypothetical protein
VEELESADLLEALEEVEIHEMRLDEVAVRLRQGAPHAILNEVVRREHVAPAQHKLHCLQRLAARCR